MCVCVCVCVCVYKTVYMQCTVTPNVLQVVLQAHTHTPHTHICVGVYVLTQILHQYVSTQAHGHKCVCLYLVHVSISVSLSSVRFPL